MTIDIDQLQALVDGMTAAPWVKDPVHKDCDEIYVGDFQVADFFLNTEYVSRDEQHANAAGIVALRNSADALLSRLRAAEGCRDTLALFVEARDPKGTGFSRYSMKELELKAKDALAAYEASR